MGGRVLMPAKFQIADFSRVSRPIKSPATKFGGDPVWLTGPTWPVSRGWPGRKMMFLCQIALDKLFQGGEDRLAYIFVTHPASPQDTFFDPDVTEPTAGENAVFVQPGGKPPPRRVEEATGPTLFDAEGRSYEGRPRLRRGVDPEFLTARAFRALSEGERERYFTAVDGNKLGGVPNFFQGDAWPKGKIWRLLLQLNANSMPFHLVLGGSPTAFAFLSESLTEGRLVVQDS